MMGSFFSNIHIRRGASVSGETILRSIETMMRSWDYERAASVAEADTAVILVDSESSDWFSVYCDELFEFEDARDFEALAELMSAELRTDVLNIGCFDSDYLYMNLINAPEQINAWVEIGECEGADNFRSNELDAWQGKVHNFSEFAQSFEGDYIFAEDVLSQMEECLCLPQAFSAACCEDFDEKEADESVRYLYFRKRANEMQSEKPHFTLLSCPLLPCFLERSSSVSVLNEGGASKGLSIFFIGSYVEHDEITFSDVRFVRHIDHSTMIAGEPFELRKVQLADGRWAYCHHEPEFVIPARINDQQMKYRKSINVCFTPHGNKRKLLDITVVLVPDENPAGQIAWNVWHRFGSKENYIREYNERFVSCIHAPLDIKDFD